jgi:hypothetical protein
MRLVNPLAAGNPATQADRSGGTHMSTISRVPLTGGLGFFSRFADVRVVADTREVRGMEETIDVREVQPNRGPSIVAADLDRDAGSLDAVAGSEYVDDRIRLRE